MGFLDWWEDKLTYSLGFLVFTHLIQIPHMIWNADVLLEAGFVSRIHPLLDFFLYGIDLIEIPAIIAVTLSFVSKIRHKV
jgi:hypothetical protein